VPTTDLVTEAAIRGTPEPVTTENESLTETLGAPAVETPLEDRKNHEGMKNATVAVTPKQLIYTVVLMKCCVFGDQGNLGVI